MINTIMDRLSRREYVLIAEAGVNYYDIATDLGHFQPVIRLICSKPIHLKQSYSTAASFVTLEHRPSDLQNCIRIIELADGIPDGFLLDCPLPLPVQIRTDEIDKKIDIV